MHASAVTASGLIMQTNVPFGHLQSPFHALMDCTYMIVQPNCLIVPCSAREGGDDGLVAISSCLSALLLLVHSLSGNALLQLDECIKCANATLDLLMMPC